jgi:hypothetical protein
LVQKYSKSLLDSVIVAVESEEVETLPYNDRLVFKTLTEDMPISKKSSGLRK